MRTEDVQEDPIDTTPTLDSDPVGTITEDLLTTNPKKKRLLSERQKDALQRGRQIRWSKNQQVPVEEPPEPLDMETQKSLAVGDTTYLENMDIDVKDPRLRALLDPETSSSESESDSSSEEEKKSSKSKKRKAKQLKKSIPKPVRRRLDKYLKMKLAESKLKKLVQVDTPAYEDTFPDSPPLPPYNPVLQHTHRTHMPFNFL